MPKLRTLTTDEKMVNTFLNLCKEDRVYSDLSADTKANAEYQSIRAWKIKSGAVEAFDEPMVTIDRTVKIREVFGGGRRVGGIIPRGE